MWKTLPHTNRRKKAPAERGCSRRRITRLTVVICEFGKRDQAAVLCSSSSTHTDTVPNEAQPSSTCFFIWYFIFQDKKNQAHSTYVCILCIFFHIFFSTNLEHFFQVIWRVFFTGSCKTPVSWNTAQIWAIILVFNLIPVKHLRTFANHQSFLSYLHIYPRCTRGGAAGRSAQHLGCCHHDNLLYCAQKHHSALMALCTWVCD